MEEMHDLMGEAAADSSKDMEISQWVYDSLMGHLIPECRAAWVENIFVPGNKCYAQYEKVYNAYDDFLGRSADAVQIDDVESIIDALLEYGRIAAIEMFVYGRRYQRMQDADSVEKQK